MEKRILLWLTGIIFAITTITAQEVPAGVVTAFKKGSSTELSTYLGDKIDVVILNKSVATDKRKAVPALNTFFTDNKVTAFAVNHTGKRDESGFFVGSLTTANGNFRVNCFFKRIEDKHLIHQIRIDKANE